MKTTFTHIGSRAAVGYQHTGRDFNHYEKRPGRTHALNRDGHRCFRAVCGVRVHEDSSDCHDQGGSNPVEVAIGSARKVTCKQCLARKPVAVERPKRVEYAVMYAEGERTACYARDRRKEAADHMAAVIAEKGRTSGEKCDRVWVEAVEVYAV